MDRLPRWIILGPRELKRAAGGRGKFILIFVGTFELGGSTVLGGMLFVGPLAISGVQFVNILVLVLAAGLVVLLLWWLAPAKCPECKITLKPLDPFKAGKTRKFLCPKCGKHVDSGVPSGKGKRR